MPGFDERSGAGFVVEEHKNGKRFYNHELTEIENLGSLGRSPDGEGRTRAGRDSIMDIVRKHLGLNPDMTQSTGNRGPAVRPEPKRHLGHAGD